MIKLNRNAAFLTASLALVGCSKPSTQLAPTLAMPKANPLATRGTSDSGGEDWFIKALPLLKISIPENGGLAEGVRYRAAHLRPCQPADSPAEASIDAPILYFLGKNFSAVKVQASANKLLCSYGVVEKDPDRAIKILANNSELSNPTDETRKYKTYGNSTVVGNYLIFSKAAHKVTVFGLAGILNLDLEQHFWQLSQDLDPTFDIAYVPSEIMPSARSYFANNPAGNWRIVLPVAYATENLPLPEFSKVLTAAYREKDSALLDLLNPVALPNGFPNGSGSVADKVAQIWSTVEHTSDDENLLNHFYKEYELPLTSKPQHGYGELKVLADTFSFLFSPTINVETVNQASYHEVGHRTTFSLPLLNPSWRVAADLIHEVTHSVQSHDDTNLDELKFKNELAAHLSERKYLKSISEKYEVIRLSAALFNVLIATTMPKLKLVGGIVPTDSTPLCENILKSYGINRENVSADVLSSAGCLQQ